MVDAIALVLKETYEISYHNAGNYAESNPPKTEKRHDYLVYYPIKTKCETPRLRLGVTRITHLRKERGAKIHRSVKMAFMQFSAIL